MTMGGTDDPTAGGTTISWGLITANIRATWIMTTGDFRRGIGGPGAAGPGENTPWQRAGGGINIA